MPIPNIIVPGSTTAGGEIAANYIIPMGLPPGIVMAIQYWIQDLGGPAGFAASNGLQLTTP